MTVLPGSTPRTSNIQQETPPPLELVEPQVSYVTYIASSDATWRWS